MRYIQRDPLDSTKIIGHFANPQSGYAEEAVPDDDPMIVAFHDARALRGLTVQEQLADLTSRVDELERKTATLP